MASGIRTKSRLSTASRALRSFFDGDAKGVSGSVAIEFGMIVPILALMLIVGADLGMGIYRKMQVESAAQAGAEYAIVNGFKEAAISAAVTSATSFTGISSSPPPTKFCGCASSSGDITHNQIACSATCPGGSPPGLYTRVSAKGTYQTILPYPAIVSNNYTFTAQSTVRVQ